MKSINVKKILGAKAAILVISGAVAHSAAPVSPAGQPVHDKENLAQNSITAKYQIEILEQLKQQHKEQLNAQQEQLNVQQEQLSLQKKKKGKDETTFLWDPVSTNVNNFMALHQGLQSYTTGKCPRDEDCVTVKGMLTQKIHQQKEILQHDLNNLLALQRSAERAQGLMETLQVSNQLASAQLNQLLQIRAILLTQTLENMREEISFREENLEKPKRSKTKKSW
jgi:conjugal transfer/entry exclusion protein